MRASQVAALRRELLGWLDTADAESYYDLMSDDPGTWSRPAQREALVEADLFFVSDEMTAVAGHASQSMPDQVPVRDEFPAECGFAVWDGPLVAADVIEKLLAAHPTAELISTCHVLSWKLMELHVHYDDDNGDDHVAGEVEVEAAVTGQEDGSGSSYCADQRVRAATLTFWVKPDNRTYPPLIPYHSAVLDLTLPIRQSARDDNEGGNEAAGAWIEHFDMAVYTTLVLMGQTVAAVTAERPERAERRRTERAGLDMRDVRVIKLRRAQAEEPPADETPAGADAADDPDGKVHIEWRRRWVVRGHWRQQWYPSLNDHRSVWIHSYVKGPEDKPLLATGADVVRALTR